MLERLGGGRTEITSLTVQVKDWPTPTGMDSKASGGSDPNNVTLTDAAVRQWPTPTAHDAKGQGHENTNLHNAAMPGPQAATTSPAGTPGSPGADLNPRFVEALMGVPAGWADPLVSLTASTSSATDSYQRWLQLHSLSSPTVSASTSGTGEAA